METRTVVRTNVRTTRNETIPRWSRQARLFLGALTFGIIALFAGSAVLLLLQHATTNPTAAPAALREITVVLLAVFAQFLLTLFYLSFAWQNPRLGASRYAWVVGILFMPWAILPIYWFEHIWGAPYMTADHSRDYNVPGGQTAPHTD